MNKWQRDVLGNRVEEDEKILKRLKKTYQQAEKDIDDNIAALMGRTDTENLQSITYQIEYQKALKSQINGILDSLNSNQFTDISQYLTESYENGFIGVMYDLQGQGIPLAFPINQEQVVRSLKNNSKLSKGLWGSLSDRNSKLQNNLRSEISRGFSQGHSYAQIAKSISNQMDIGFNKVSRIVRTESHRISNEAAMDAMHKAKDNGADVVKQWDATIDKRTRPHHAQLDGQIRELDEPFEVAGHTAMYPGGFGNASEDIHCRCAVLQRAKWALDEDELQTLKDRAEALGLDKNDNFAEFKKKYLQSVKKSEPKMAYNKNADVSYITDTYGEAHADKAKQLLDNADPEVRKLWNKCQGKFKTSDANYKGTKAFYSPITDDVTLNIASTAKGSSYQTPYQTLFHEYGHMSDFLLNRTKIGSKNKRKGFSDVFNGIDADGKVKRTTGRGLLGKTAKGEVEKMISDAQTRYGVKTKREAANKLIEEINSKYSLVARGDVSDMLEGAGIGVNYPCGVGHGSEYWKGRDNGKEIFAEITSAEIANPESLACIKEYFPETYKVYRQMLGVIK